jgi:hypothetical protein
MSYDKYALLWKDQDERFFQDQIIIPVKQPGPHCVSTALAMLSGKKPKYFMERINTENPVTWSRALRKWEMKLAFTPFDIRKLMFYMEELIGYDDLFLLSYYAAPDPVEILAAPNDDGWICRSHIVILHRDKIYDPGTGSVEDAQSHQCSNFHTKRIFRVVPMSHPLGL